MGGARVAAAAGLGVVIGHGLEKVAAEDSVLLGRLDGAGGQHGVQDRSPAILRGGLLGGCAEGVIARRPLRESRQEGGLRQVEIGGVDAEVVVGRGFHAQGPVAVVDGVQVKLEDLVLGVAALQLLGQE